MFNRLKEKLAAEVRQSPQRLQTSVQSLGQLGQSFSPFRDSATTKNATEVISASPDSKASTSSSSSIQAPNLIDLHDNSSSILDSSENQQFSIADDDGASSATTSPVPQSLQQTNFENVDLSDVTATPTYQSNAERTRTSSVSSTSSQPPLLPLYTPATSNYNVQSDLESASEVEDSSGINLDMVTKEQLFQAFQKAKMRYLRTKGRYGEVVKAYREQVNEKEKIKTILTESQDKALRRISELREQSQLESKAKAHLEDSFRVTLEEKDELINVLHTQIRLLKSGGNVGDAGSDGPLQSPLIELSADEDASKSETETEEDLRLKLKSSEETIIKLKALLKNCKETITNNRTNTARLVAEKEELEKTLNESKHEERSSMEALESARNEIDSLKLSESEHALKTAEAKRVMHEEMEAKERELSEVKSQLSELLSEKKEFEKQIQEKSRMILALEESRNEEREKAEKKLEVAEKAMEVEKQELLQEMSRGKQEAVALLQKEMIKDLAEKQNEISRLQDSLSESAKLAETSHSELVEILSREKSSLEAELHQRINTEAELRETVSQLTLCRDALETNLKSERDTGLRLRSVVQEVLSCVKGFNDVKSKIKEEVLTLSSDVSVQKAEVDARLSELVNLHQRLSAQWSEEKAKTEAKLFELQSELGTSQASQETHLNALMREAEESLKQSQDENANLQEFNLSLMDKIKLLEETVRSLEDKIVVLRTSEQELERVKLNVTEEVEQLRRRMTLLEQEKADLEQKLSKQQEVLTSNEAVIGELNLKADEMKNQFEEVLRNLSLATEEKCKVESELSVIIQDSNRHLAELEERGNETESLKSDLSAATERVSHLESKLEEMSGELVEKYDNIEKLTVQLCEFETREKTLQEDLISARQKAEVELSCLQKMLDDTNQQLVSSREMVSSFQTDSNVHLRNLTDELQSQRKLIEQREARITELECTIDTKEREYLAKLEETEFQRLELERSLDSLVTESQSTKSALVSEMNELKLGLSTFQERAGGLEQDIEKYKASEVELTKLRAVNLDLETVCAQLKTEIGDIKREVDSYREQLNSANQALKLEAEAKSERDNRIQKLLSEAEKQSAKLHSSEVEVEQLKTELNELRVESGKILIEIEDLRNAVAAKDQEKLILEEKCVTVKDELEKSISDLLAKHKEDMADVQQKHKEKVNEIVHKFKSKLKDAKNTDREAISELEKKLQLSKEAESKLGQDAATLSSSLQSVERKLAGLAEENRTLVLKVEGYDEARSNLESSGIVLAAKLDEVQAALTLSQSECERIRSESRELNEKVVPELRHLLETKEAKIAELDHVITSQKASVTSELENMEGIRQSEAKNFISEIDRLNQQVRDYQETIKSMEKLVDELRMQQQSKEDEVLLQMEAVKNGAKGVQNDFEQTLAETSAANKELEITVKNLIEQAELKSQRVEELQSQLQLAQGRETEAEEKYRKTAEESQTKLNDLKKKAENKLAQIKRQLVSEAERTQNELQLKIESLLKEHEKELTDKTKLLAESELRLSAVTSQSEALMTQNENQNLEMEKFRSELATKNNQIDESLITAQVNHMEMLHKLNELQNKYDELIGSWAQKEQEMEERLSDQQEEHSQKLKQLAKDFSQMMTAEEEQSKMDVAQVIDSQIGLDNLSRIEHAKQMKDLQEELLNLQESVERLMEEKEQLLLEKDARQSSTVQDYETKITELKSSHQIQLDQLERKWKGLMTKELKRQEVAHEDEVVGLSKEWDMERKFDADLSFDSVAEIECLHEELQQQANLASSAVESGGQSAELLRRQIVSMKLQMESLQERHKAEVKELHHILRATNLPVPLSETNGEADMRDQPVLLSLEIEYLKNILYEYMMGKETVTLTKVIAAVLRFSEEQTKKVIAREQEKINGVSSQVTFLELCTHFDWWKWHIAQKALENTP